MRTANPPVIRPSEIDEFIDEVFGNVLDLRECNRQLLETIYVRQREQAPVIQCIGDIFLDAATQFRLAYPIYVGHLPVSEKRMKDELEKNAEFKRFVEVRHSAVCSKPGSFVSCDSPYSKRRGILTHTSWT